MAGSQNRGVADVGVMGQRVGMAICPRVAVLQEETGLDLLGRMSLAVRPRESCDRLLHVLGRGRR